MPPADNRAALTAATRHRSDQARARAREAIRRLDRDGLPVTFAAIAAVADVSRSLLYRDPDLRDEIQRLRVHSPIGNSQPPAAERSSEVSLRQRLSALLDDNRILRDENTQLRNQIAMLLGEQRAENHPRSHRARTIGPCS